MLVIVSHGGMVRVVPGGLGVTIFFVVSGYLITTQLIAEADRTGRIGLGNFYLRRILRLLPALLAYIAISVPLFIALGLDAPIRDVLSAVFYYANYNFIYHRAPAHSPVSLLWSLSVEEHYYLLFPFIIMLSAARLRRLLVPIVLAIAFALLWRYVLATSCSPQGSLSATLCGLAWPPGATENRRIYLGTDSRYDSILAGALLAFVASFRAPILQAIARRPVAFWTSAGLLVLTLVVRDRMFRDTLRYTLQELAVAVMLAGLVSGRPKAIVRLLSWRPLVYVGRLSYSLYLWHWAALCAVVAAGGVVRPPRPAFAAYLGASFLLAALSFHLIEKPVMRLRRSAGSHTPVAI